MEGASQIYWGGGGCNNDLQRGFEIAVPPLNFSVCFLLVLELTACQWRKGFEPEGSSVFLRLIATSGQGGGGGMPPPLNKQLLL